MMTKIGRALLCLCLSGALCLAITPAGFGQDARDDAGAIAARLTGAGFENVRVHVKAGAVIAHIENRTYRWQVRGLQVALDIVCGAASPTDQVTVVVRRLDVPMVTVTVRAGEWLAAGSRQRPRLYARSGLDPTATASSLSNPSLGRADLTLGPGVRLRLVTPASDRGVAWRLNPGLEIALAPGLCADVVALVPVNGERPHAGRALLSQVVSAGSGLYLGLTAGQLDEDRSGWIGEAAWVGRDGRNTVSLTATGLSAGAWADRKKPTLLAGVSHRLAGPDIEASAWVGQFADGDRGAEVALTSRFRDWALQVFHVRTNWTRQAGFALRIPLGPPVQPEPAPLRARLRDYFNFRYRAPDERGGCRVITGHSIADLNDDLLPVRIEQYLAPRHAPERDLAPTFSGPS